MKAIVRSLAVEMALQQRATGRRIAQLRERARLTQEAAADKAGVTLRAYQKWEAGGGIQYANLQKLADALSTTVEEITGAAETPSPFRVSDQLADVTTEFHERVDAVEAHLDRIENAVAEARRERDEHVDDIKALLAEQSALLETIRAILGIDAEGEFTIQERLIGMLRDAAARSGAPSGPSKPS